jgi:hypothetical protein
MNRDDFALFVAKTLEEVTQLAEKEGERKLSREFAFQWLGSSSSRITENIVEHIVQRVFVDEDHIYPCVDIGVADLLEHGSLLIVGSVAGYAPRPFGRNWTDREGPFVHIVGQPFLSRMAGKEVNWSPKTGVFGYITPDLKNIRRQ